MGNFVIEEFSPSRFEFFYSFPGPAGMYGAPFTFYQVNVSLIEFQALPGPEARALRAKIIRQHSFSGLGGQAVLSPGTGLFRCRGGRTLGGPATKLRNADCGMRIEEEDPKNPKSEIRNPK